MQLVGEMELQSEEVQLPDGTVRVQKSTVYIKKCRYLEQSGCVGMCVNMCKVRVTYRGTYVEECDLLMATSTWLETCNTSICSISYRCR